MGSVNRHVGWQNNDGTTTRKFVTSRPYLLLFKFFYSMPAPLSTAKARNSGRQRAVAAPPAKQPLSTGQRLAVFAAAAAACLLLQRLFRRRGGRGGSARGNEAGDDAPESGGPAAHDATKGPVKVPSGAASSNVPRNKRGKAAARSAVLGAARATASSAAKQSNDKSPPRRETSPGRPAVVFGSRLGSSPPPKGRAPKEEVLGGEEGSTLTTKSSYTTSESYARIRKDRGTL